MKTALAFAQIFSLPLLAVAVVVAASQTCAMKSDYEARSRPYLAIEDIQVNNDITVKEENDDWLYIDIDLMNFGELPATIVSLDSILMGGEEIAWTSTGEYVIAPAGRDFPSDLIFYPGRHSSIPILVDKETWESTITEGTILDIELQYSWAEKHYWYVAKATLESDGKWRMLYDRCR